MTTALEGGEGSASRPGCLPPIKNPDTHWIRGWVGPKTGLGVSESRRVMASAGIRSPDRLASSLVTILTMLSSTYRIT